MSVVGPGPDARVGGDRPLRPLRALVAALLLVVVDLRLGGDVDLLPDVLGWLLAAYALLGLARLHRGFAVAGVAALAGVAPALGELAERGQGWAALLEGAALTVLLFATCAAVGALVPAEARLAARLRWWDLGLTAALLLVGLVAGAAAAGPGQVGGVGAVGGVGESAAAGAAGLLLVVVLPLGIALVVVFVLFLLLLLRVGRRPLVPPAPPPARAM